MRSKRRQKSHTQRRSTITKRANASTLQSNDISQNNKTPSKGLRKSAKSNRKRKVKVKGRLSAMQRQRQKLLAELAATTAAISDEMHVGSQQQALDDDQPTTSAAAINGTKTFKKFRDNLKAKKQPRRRVLKRLNISIDSASTSASQIVTKKLLRSIKRRQLVNITPHNQRSALARRLNFAGSANAAKVVPQTQKNTVLHSKEVETRKDKVQRTLEEGEIASDAETTQNVADDDDCICVEPHIEAITIEDDTMTDAHSTEVSSGYVSILEMFKNCDKAQKRTPLFTSTPCQKQKPSYADITAAVQTTTHTNDIAKPTTDVPVPFFEDVAPTPWFETVNSTDTFTDYTKLTTLSDSRVRKRRSARLGVQNVLTNSADVILIDDTICESTLKHESDTTKNAKNADDSVIFVSEENPNNLPTFIPLVDDKVPNPIAIINGTHTPRKRKPNTVNNALFTASEKKALNSYNNNAYNPNSASTQQQQTQKRMVLIDGSNVAFQHALNKEFSVRGLKICIDYFESMQHEVKAVVPQFRLQRTKSTDPIELERLHRAGKIVFTPCKNLPGKCTTSYDDRFVLQLACELDAAVVSNDNYRDLVHENAAFKKIIENRVIGYTWCNDIFILPKDPYGKWGPTLHTILNRV